MRGGKKLDYEFMGQINKFAFEGTNSVYSLGSFPNCRILVEFNRI